MKQMELLQALTDVDDAFLLEAEEAPRRSKPLRGLLRFGVAACLTVLVTLSAIFAADALTAKPELRYTVRYRDTCVTYLLKVTAVQHRPMPSYELGWLPPRYHAFQETKLERRRDISYRSTEEDYLWFRCQQITENTTERFYNLPLGSYGTGDVDINGNPGILYRYTDGREGGYLIWMDMENCVMLTLGFEYCAEAEVLQIAQNVTVSH